MIPKGVYTPLGIIRWVLYYCRGHAMIPKGVDPPRNHHVGSRLL